MDSGISRGISSSIRRKLSILLETLRKDPNFELSIYPIGPVRDGCLDYFFFFKTPMDLITVSNLLLDDQYKNIKEIFHEIELTFSNCLESNTSPLCQLIIDSCDKGEHRFLQEWTKLRFFDKSTNKRLDELSKGLNIFQPPNISSCSNSPISYNNTNPTETGSNTNQYYPNSIFNNEIIPIIPTLTIVIPNFLNRLALKQSTQLARYYSTHFCFSSNGNPIETQIRTIL
ncbi:hypothetical protein [Cryptosporidium hominis TU502]|uniref:hypothetical protein n=1 Tax=Cryptosporidium hominis (strain TU502) TaxID=353151 RepID=UPI0000452AA5|nr:hypothetical protein [Cryptosporidium hominis TU502]